MKTVLRYTLIISVTLAVVGAGILLPSRITGLQDAQIIGKIKFEPMEGSTAGYRHQLSIIEKVQLIDGEQSNTIAIPLDQGREMDAAGAVAAWTAETGALTESGLLPELNAADENIAATAVNYYMSTASPSQYVILWVLSLKIDRGYGEFYLDDETGKILGFTLESNDTMPVTMTTEEIAEAWGDYLGVDLVDIGDKLGNIRKEQDPLLRYFYAVYQDEKGTTKYPITVNENSRVFGAAMPTALNQEYGIPYGPLYD